MGDRESSLPLDAFIDGSLKPDGIDQADMEALRRRLEAEREALVQKTILIPGRKKSLLAELEQNIDQVARATMAGRDHVRSDPVKDAIYQQRKAEHAKAEFDAAERLKAEQLERRKIRQKTKSLEAGAEPDPTD